MSTILPGTRVGRSMVPREIMLSREAMIQVPIVLDPTLSVDGRNDVLFEIRPGWLMGRVAASGRWTPCKRTTVTSTGGATAATIPVVNAAAFRVGDTISVGGDTGKQITAINYQTNVITVAGAAFTFASSEPVLAEDGSQTCRGALLDFARLRDEDGVTPVPRSAGLLIQGAVQTAMLLGDVAAIRADGAARVGGLRFSDEHGH